MLKRVGRWIRARLESPRAPLWIVVLALALTVHSLWNGLTFDDCFHYLAVVKPQALSYLPPFDAFNLYKFLPGPPGTSYIVDHGGLPWWAAPELKVQFWRPLASLTIFLDYKIWPNPVMGHISALLWFAALVAAAGAVYRHFLEPRWLANLAMLFFAVDDAHGGVVGYIAAHNTLMASTFSLVAFLFFCRWRRDGWRPGRLLGPACFVVAYASGEFAVFALGLFGAYALFMDRAGVRRGIVAITPYVVVTILWRILYSSLGYGVSNAAGNYFDPVNGPGRYALHLLKSVPEAGTGQFFGPWYQVPYYYFVYGPLLVLLVWGLWPRLRSDPTTRFFAGAFGLMFFFCALTWTSDRILVLAGVPGMGLVARLVADHYAELVPRRETKGGRFAASALAGLLVFHNGVLGPLLLPVQTVLPKIFSQFFLAGGDALPHDEEATKQDVIVVNAPFWMTISLGNLAAVGKGMLPAKRILLLGDSEHAVTVKRLDERTLSLRPEGGYLATELDEVIHDRSLRYTPGQRIEMPGWRVEIVDVTEDGRPAEIRCVFDAPLESTSYRWITARKDAFIPFALPKIGEETSVDSN